MDASRVAGARIRGRGTRWRSRRLGLWGMAVLVAAVLGGALVGGGAAQTAEEPLDAERPWADEADRLFAAGELERALKLYEELTLAHTDDSGLWLRIAMIHLTARRNGDALEAAQTAFELAPDVDATLVLAQCQVAVGDVDRGVTTLERGLRQFPQETEILESLATVSLAREEWAKAGGLLRELIRLDPTRPDYRLDLARLLMMSNDPAGAEEQLTSLLEMQPDSPVARALLGRALLIGQRSEEARGQFEASLALRETAEAHAGLGAVAFISGDFDTAVAHLRQARALDSTDPDVLFNLGNALVQNGEVGEAIEAYRASLELDPQAATTHANLGVLLLNLLQVDEAKAHLGRAVALDPSLPEPHLHLARIAAADFDFEGAVAFYRAYQERLRDPDEVGRIAEIIENLEIRAKESREALARGEVHLLQLMVTRMETAEAIVRRVEQGEDFYTLAHQNSELAKVAGVDTGFVDPHGLSDVFRDPILGLQVGQMTEILTGSNGFYIFMRVQ